MELTPNQVVAAIAIGVVAIVGLALLVLFAQLFRPWLRAYLHGTPVPIFQIVGMKLRRNPTQLLIEAYITLKRKDDSVRMDLLESTYIDHRGKIVTYEDLVRIYQSRP